MLKWKRKEDKPSKPVLSSGNYFSTWYAKNKSKLSSKRKTRYNTDLVYKEEQIRRAREYREGRKIGETAS
jgi:hypothetical protein